MRVKLIQHKTRFHPELHQKLKAAAEKSGLSLNAELQRRLDRSFWEDYWRDGGLFTVAAPVGGGMTDAVLHKNFGTAALPSRGWTVDNDGYMIKA
jgi:hypothetical protein